MLADERASKEHPRGREVRGGAPGEEGQCAHALVCWLFKASRPFPRSSRAKSSHEGRARGLCGEIVWQCVVRRASSLGMVRRLWGGAVGLCAGCCAGRWEEERGERG